MNFSNKVCVVTGASSGIGKHFVEHFVGNGGNAVMLARRIGKLEEIADNFSECSFASTIWLTVGVVKSSCVKLNCPS